MPKGIYIRTEKHKKHWFKKGEKKPFRKRPDIGLLLKKNNWLKEVNLGKKHTEEHKRKIGESNRNEKHWNWQNYRIV